MQITLETLSALERRMRVTVPVAEIDGEVETRLRKLSRTVKLRGFRPGKVPLKVVEQQYGLAVRQEVLGDTIQKSFGQAVRDRNLRVAGMPRFEPRPADADPAAFEYSATFEVYPEVKLGDVRSKSIERPVVSVADADVDKTIEILRRQRTRYEPVERGVESADRVKIDFRGTIDGQPFEGGEASDASLVLGHGRLLPDFEAALAGLRAGEAKTFELVFPSDYGARELAGKTACFAVTVKEVAAPVLPALDAEFAQRFGIADGDLAKMRAEVAANVQREVERRTRARVKEQALAALAESTPVEVPKSLVDAEIDRLVQSARADLESRGVDVANTPIPREVFEGQARQRVSLGLILAELVKAHGLHARPDQVKAMIESLAESYERPQEVVRWYYQSAERLSEVEALVIEDNVVSWVLGEAQVVDRPTAFDELMGTQQQGV
jgi:trigger factor